MESVRDKRTREIVEAEDLWLFDSVDAEGYLCWGCGIEMPLYSLMPSGLKLIEQRPVVDPSATGCENNSSTIRSASSTSGESNSPVMALQRKLKSSLVFSHFSTSHETMIYTQGRADLDIFVAAVPFQEGLNQVTIGFN